jgi:hypothetical protein
MYNMQVLKNNGSMRAQLPSFVKVESVEVEVEVPQCLDDDERLSEMVTYLLQIEMHCCH